MSQQKPEAIDEILRLVDKLSREEHDQLVEEMKLQWLRKALDEGEESSRLHGTRPAEEVLAEMKQRAEERLRKSRQ